ncbi:MAG: AAA family ATPase [Spirochaetales bacterium]|nr:AAA family ATPase [Spirochaetales bacterium]
MGFKSFADRTHIDFSPGISALLGPNGCGKSNIVDAVKWVLGEQSTKNMRAMKMEDVIFNGTVKRKALNVAEVTLTISNETNILDLDAPEIEIKRRLYRDGDSEYFINNTSVRLKELRELFFDTGIGKTAYSILEQGKIDQILSNKPEERRYLFEEAAGITKHKQKGFEAEKKLEKTRDNIKQIENILSEVSKNYFTLKEQAEKTEEYRSIKDKLFEVDVNLQLLKIQKLKELHERRGEEHQKREKTLHDLQKEIDELDSNLNESHKKQSKLNHDLSENQKELYGIELEKETLKNNLDSNKNREKEYNLQLESLTERESKYTQRSLSLKNDINLRTTEKNKLKEDFTLAESNLTKNLQEVDSRNSLVQDISSKIEVLKNNLINFELSKDDTVSKIQELATSITNKIEKSLNNFSLEEYNTYIDLFRSRLKLAKTNPSILVNLENEFDEILKIIPIDIINLISQDKDLEAKRDLDSKIEEINKSTDKCKKDISKLDAEKSLNLHNIEITNEIISKNKVEIAELKIKISGIDENISLINKNLQEEESLLTEIKKERIQLIEKIKQLKLDKEKIEDTKKKYLSNEENIKKKIKAIEDEILSLKQNNSHKEKTLTIQKESLSKLTLQIERFNFEAEHLENKVEELYTEFQDRYSVELTEVSKNVNLYSQNEDELKATIQDLKVKQKMVGQINLMAPEEFKEVSKRYLFLKGQIDDLKKSDENLLEITQKIKIESTKLFKETFESIQQSFSEMYKKLFGGGEAELKLTDPKNILESGIEIYARPPGKSLENISLLSGGERSLTAVALLFATYIIKPSPFCILDEIDAALDERNISRFVNTLTEFAKESQFIVITHNKKTVTGSGALLGVTMEESGVSKLITMRLDHGEEA